MFKKSIIQKAVLIGVILILSLTAFFGFSALIDKSAKGAIRSIEGITISAKVDEKTSTNKIEVDFGNNIEFSMYARVSGTYNSHTIKWYANSQNSTSGGDIIRTQSLPTGGGSVSDKFSVVSDKVGKFYYYFVLDSQWWDDKKPEAPRTSSIIEVTQNSPEPTIEKQPQPNTTVRRTDPLKLSVEASNKSGTLTYQWYKLKDPNSSTQNPDVDDKLDNQTSTELDVDTSKVGNQKYYVQVTNTINTTKGDIERKVNSGLAHVVVQELPTSVPPVIKENPISKTYGTVNLGDTVRLSVEVSNESQLKGLTYQWYYSDTKIESSRGGKAIDGATNSVIEVKLKNYGKTYYYVVLTNLDSENHSAVEVASDVAYIEVIEYGDNGSDGNISGGDNGNGDNNNGGDTGDNTNNSGGDEKDEGELLDVSNKNSGSKTFLAIGIIVGAIIVLVGGFVLINKMNSEPQKSRKANYSQSRINGSSRSNNNRPSNNRPRKR